MRYKEITSIPEVNKKIRDGWTVSSVEDKGEKIIFHMMKENEKDDK